MNDPRQLHLFKGARQRGVAVQLRRTEFELHCQVADMLRRWATPGWLWTHLPMGELRTPATAARLARMGVGRGWPDFLLLAPHVGRAHFLELKRQGAKLGDDQVAFAFYCSVNGYPHSVVDSFGDALDLLKAWGAVRSTISA